MYSCFVIINNNRDHQRRGYIADLKKTMYQLYEKNTRLLYVRYEFQFSARLSVYLCIR